MAFPVNWKPSRALSGRFGLRGRQAFEGLPPFFVFLPKPSAQKVLCAGLCPYEVYMEQQIPKKSNILRFFPFTKGFRGKFVLAFLMVILAVVANYMTPR